MGLYGWGLGAGVSISHIAYTQSWLNRSNSLWAEDFFDYSSWANLEGPNWALNPAKGWHSDNPNGYYVVTVGMLPGSGNTPLSGTSLANGAAGNYNANFATLAQNLVAYGLADHTIIRLGHEFTGNWYPWKVTSDADALNFAAYFRNIVTAMKAVPGAANVKFCWNGNNGWTSYPVGDAYPGDAYVDYVGVDIYDQSWGLNNSSDTYPYPVGDTPADMLVRQQKAWTGYAGTGNAGLAWWKNFAASHSKPLAIPEWGITSRSDGHGGLDNTYYMQQMYNFIQDPANNVAWHMYFDVNAGDGGHQLTQLPGGGATAFPNAAALFRQLFGVPPLPVNTDIGTVGLTGGQTPFTTSGAGTGYVTATSDSFHFAARPVTGDDMFLSQITSMSVSTGQSGIMLRQGTAVADPYAALFVSNGKCIFQSRTSSGGTAAQNFVVNSVTTPVWLKMLRTGNVITGYESSDGLNWTYAGSQTVTMTSAAYFGVAVSSGSTSILNATGVDNVDNADINANVPGVTSAIIIDSAATTGLVKTGSWTVSGTTTSAYGSTTLTAWTPATPSSLTFTPTIPVTGQYEVYLRRLSSYQFGDHTPLKISSTSGTSTGLIDEQIGDQLWNYLGTFNFAAGTTGSLSINNTSPGGYGYVSADAVMYVPLPQPTLPAPKMDADIGSPALAGSGAYSTGTFTVQGSGADIYGTSDQFNFVSQAVSGNQTLIARVTGLTNTNGSAKAGVMCRMTSDANSPFVMEAITPSGFVEMVFRTSTGGSAGYTGYATGVTPSATTPIWLKLVRSGSGAYNGYYATTVGTPAAADWHGVGSLYLTPSSYFAGLAVTSHTNSALATGTFDNVSP